MDLGIPPLDFASTRCSFPNLPWSGCRAAQELMEEYEELREEHYAGQEDRNYLDFEKARNAGLQIDFKARPPAPAPAKLGVTVTTGDYELVDVLDYIDWNPFFQVTRSGVGSQGLMASA